jgi:hypothetical protein
MRIGQTLLDGFRQHGNQGRVRTGATGLRAFASEAGGCQRETAYKIQEGAGLSGGRKPWDTTLSSEVSFAIGRALEQPVYNAIFLQDPAAQTQVAWVTAGGKVTGVADAAYEVRPGSEPGTFDYSQATIVEIKTLTQTYFKRALKSGPEERHVLQAAVSAVALGAPWCHLVYICKNCSRDDHPLLEWRFQTPNDLGLKAIEDMVNVVDAVAVGDIPAPIYGGDVIEFPNPEQMPCMYCNFMSRCVRDGPQVRRNSEQPTAQAGATA